MQEALDPAARNQAVQPFPTPRSESRQVCIPSVQSGMDDFVGSAAFEKRKENLSLSLKKTSRANAPPAKHPCLVAVNVDRFDFGKEDSYGKMLVPFVPKNTKKNNDWASKNFEECMENRNRAHPDNKCPSDLPWDTKAMAYWLPRFACETRNKSGGRYLATTIVSLLSGLQRRVRAVDPDAPNYLSIGHRPTVVYAKRVDIQLKYGEIVWPLYVL